MALDSFLRGNSPLEELLKDSVEPTLPKDSVFSTISGKKAFSREYYLSIPLTTNNDMSNALIELAFHYIAKVLVAAFCNDTNCDPLEYSVAQRSLENLKWRLSSNYYNELKERFDYAAMRIQDYIGNGNDKFENIIQQCWFLGKLDICYRRSAVPSDMSQFFTPANKDETDELLDMALNFRRSFIPKIITPTSRVIFNPEFGFGEYLIGETDCDMIIDRTIVDLRTHMGTFYPEERIEKSMMHFLMTELNGEFGDNESAFPIDNLAFYSARYGETELLSIDDINPSVIDKALDKLIIVTEAKHKIKKDSLQFPPNQQVNMNTSGSDRTIEKFPVNYEDNERKADYNDGYNQVVKKEKSHHIFRKILIFLIIISLLIVAFIYAKNWYTNTYGAEYSFEEIYRNLFG